MFLPNILLYIFPWYAPARSWMGQEGDRKATVWVNMLHLFIKLLPASCGSRWLDWYTLHYLPSNSFCAWWWMVLAPWVLTVPWLHRSSFGSCWNWNSLEWIERNPGSRYKWKTFGNFGPLFIVLKWKKPNDSVQIVEATHTTLQSIASVPLAALDRHVLA